MQKLILALIILTGSIASYAQDSTEGKTTGIFPELRAAESNEQKWSAGVASGISSPKGDATSSTEFGVIIGFQPIVPVSAGIEANTTRLNTDNDVRQTNVLIRSAYNFGGDIPVLRSSFVGMGLGPVFVSNRVRWAGAPLIGFDIPLSNKTRDYLSLGLEAKYLFMTNTDVPNLFASALALKYWF